MSLSGQRPRKAPATNPKASPSTPESTQAVNSSHRELPSRWPTTESTGCRYSKEVPKSPWRTLESHPRYRWAGGWSTPQ